MAKKPSKVKGLKPWDRRPWPKCGDRSIRTTYAAVGCAISQWERYEWVLSHLFSAIVAGKDAPSARIAYCAVRTFEGRRDMLRAASTAFLSTHPNAAAAGAIKKVITAATEFSKRRNEIVHGAVGPYLKEDRSGVWCPRSTFALYPSLATFQNRNAKGMPGAPEYCYSSIELEYFVNEFSNLVPAVLSASAIFAMAQAAP